MEKGITVKGIRVHFSWMQWQQMKPTVQGLKHEAKLNRKKKAKETKQKWISTFPRSLDDPVTLGGLLQPRSERMQNVTTILHDSWYCAEANTTNEKKNNNNNNNEKNEEKKIKKMIIK
ncbi:hypothetical protein RFI_16636, partial [Reticulomyxa filosa]